MNPWGWINRMFDWDAKDSLNVRKGIFSIGGVPIIAGVGIGKTFFVDGGNGDDARDGKTPAKSVKTISAALALCTSGRNDTVVVIPSTTAIIEAAAVDWNLDLTHLIGIGAQTRYGKRTRIISGADDLSPWITVSGMGCIFRNLRLVHEQASDTSSLIAVKVTGQRNYFENVEFCGNATASSAIDGGCSLYLQSGGENHFADCAIGLDTIAQETGCMAMVIHTSGGAARTRFEHCMFNGYANSTSAGFVEFLGATGIDRTMVFENCEFWNLGPQTMASAFVFGAVDPNYKRVLLRDCTKLGATDWDHANTGMVYTNIAAQTTTNAAGTAVVTSS